jgi:uncharacterized protein YggT (Ycf19 family)
MKKLSLKEMTYGQALVYFIFIFVIIAEVVLAFRFFLLLFGANMDAPFATWIYELSYRVMAPFRGIFDVREIGEGFYVDFAGLFGMLVYALLAFWLTNVVNRFDYKK